MSYDLILNASEWKVAFYWEQQRYFLLFQVSDPAAVILNKAAIGGDTETRSTHGSTSAPPLLVLPRSQLLVTVKC